MCRCFRFKTGICLCRHTLCSWKPQRTSSRFYGAVSARALSFVIVLHQVMRKLDTSGVPCRRNPQHTILHSMRGIYIYFFPLVCAVLSELLCSFQEVKHGHSLDPNSYQRTHSIYKYRCRYNSFHLTLYNTYKTAHKVYRKLTSLDFR